jgi:hypothetical protein
MFALIYLLREKFLCWHHEKKLLTIYLSISKPLAMKVHTATCVLASVTGIVAGAEDWKDRRLKQRSSLDASQYATEVSGIPFCPICWKPDSCVSHESIELPHLVRTKR